VIAEEYLSGMQLSTEGLALDGRTTTVAWAERYYDRLEEFAPYVIETGGLLSARLDEGEVRAVCEVMDRAARSLGIADGPVKGDLVMTERGPVVIELAARLSGGWFCTHQIPRARGVDLVRQTIRLALGERPDPAELVAEQRCFLSGRYFFPRPGVVESIEGYDELAAEPWVFRRVLHVEPGDEIAPTTSHPSRAGCVFTTGDTAEEAEARALACVERIRIVTRPLAPHSAAPGTSPAAPRP
jgi:biotin carboxylase